MSGSGLDAEFRAFRKSRGAWAAFRDRLVHKDEPEYLDGDDVPDDVRLEYIRQVDRVNASLGFTCYLLAKIDALLGSAPHQKSPVRILDAGFGGGGLLEAVHRRLASEGVRPELHGVELSEALVRGVRERFERLGIPVTLTRCDARRMPFDDGHFDLVFSSYTVHHLRRTEEVTEFFKELRRVGRSGFVIDLDRRLLTPAYCALIGLFGVAPLVVSDGIRSARRAYSAEEIRFLLRASSLDAAPVPLRCSARRLWPYWSVRWSPRVPATALPPR